MSSVSFRKFVIVVTSLGAVRPLEDVHCPSAHMTLFDGKSRVAQFGEGLFIDSADLVDRESRVWVGELDTIVDKAAVTLHYYDQLSVSGGKPVMAVPILTP